MKRLRTLTVAERKKPPSPVPYPKSATLPSMSHRSGYKVQHDSSGCDRQGLLLSGGGDVAIPSSASQIAMKSQITDEEVVYDVPRKHVLDAIETQPNPSYVAISPLQTGTASPDSETTSSEGLSIQQLVQNHVTSLPAQTKVVRGYYGQNVELIADELYNIHFVKHQKVVNIKDEQGNTYTVPLASSLQFGLVFNRDTRQEDNITFHKASDIMAQKCLPGVVCATKAFQGADEMSSVQENEILRVQCVQMHGKETLKVFSFATQTEKVLQADCAGDFSTEPSLIRLHLSDIITCIPCRAVIFVDEMAPTIAKKLSASLLSGPIIVTESKVVTSLVASLSKKPAKPSQKNSGKVTLLDIPLADHLAEVEFAILEPTSSQESQLLCEDTRSIMREFDPRKLKHLTEAKSSRIARVQLLLYTEIQNSQKFGIELECSIQDESPPPMSLMKLSPRKSTPKRNNKLPQGEAESPKVMEKVMYETLPGETKQDEVHIHDPATQADTRRLPVLTKPKPAPANSKESAKKPSIARVPPTPPPRKYFPSSPSLQSMDDTCPPGTPNGNSNVPPGNSNVPPGKPNVPPGNSKVPPGPNVPPGKPNVPPGNSKVLPGPNVPPGKPNVPPGNSKVPPGSNVPPGKPNVPPGNSKVLPGPNVPPGKPNVPPGNSKVPPGSNVPPGKPNVPPGKPVPGNSNVPPGPNVPPGNPNVPPGKPDVPPTGSEYSKSSPKPTPAVRKKPEVNVKPSKSEDDSYVRLHFHTRTEPIEVRLNFLESQSKKHDEALQRLDDMQSTLERVAMKLLSLETQVQTLTLSSVSSPLEDTSSSSPSTRQQNQQYLRSLDNTQIQRLLEAMDLVQYKEAIIRECIDGEILYELDEQSLESDLGIAAKLHRVRLMKVICGYHSAEHFLTQTTRS